MSSPRAFQSTRPRGARLSPCSASRKRHHFNPRAHAGRDCPALRGSSGKPHFNPRAHAGRDLGVIQYLVDVEISIHAPTRGATPLVSPCVCSPQISIHAPTRGATRRRNGVDVPAPISIHAPTRGATVALLPLILSDEFQSTRPRGARHLRRRLPCRHRYFNPRAHAGRDQVIP